MREQPLVTVGIPVYNEEPNITATLKSILDQDYSNCKILISDNCSTDNTVQVLEEFAKKYPQIEIIRNPTNVGALENWNQLIKKADTMYFTMIGSHDLISKDYISGLLNSLQSRPDAVLAYGRTQWISYDNKPINKDVSYYDTSGLSLIKRFNFIFWGNQHALYGMYRLSTLKRTRLQLQVIGSGAILLSELSLYGHIIFNPFVTWYRKANRNWESSEQSLNRYSKSLFKRKKRMYFPHWKFLFYYTSIVFFHKISVINRLILIINIPFIFFVRYYPQLLYQDFLFTLKRVFKLKL